MQIKCLRLCAVLLFMLSLSACFGGQAQKPEVQTPLSPVGEFMTMNEPGATAVIDDPDFGGEVRVTLEDSFVSAAGEACRRATVLSAAHEAEIVVICRNGADGWLFAPRVWGKGL